MVSEDNETPVIANVGPELLEAIRANLEVNQVPTADVPETFVQPVKRKRGRPRKHPVSETGTTVPELAAEEAARTGTPLPAAKLGKRDEREVSERIANMLLAGTGIASQAKSYLAMTDDEAKAIADPLSSYLVRNADTIPVAQQVLENYDLLAITLGILAYAVRIYRERTDEIAEQRAQRATGVNGDYRSALDVVGQHSASTNNGQAEGSPTFVSSPYGS